MGKSFLNPFIFVLAVHLLLVFGGLTFSAFKAQKVSYKTSLIISLLKNSQQLQTTPLKKKSLPPVTNTPNQAAPVNQQNVRPEAQASATVAVGPLSDQVKADLRTLYQMELRQKIEENKFYPAMSKRLGHKGLVVIAFTLLEDGNIIDVRIEKPSAFEGLNLSALEAVKRVERFKPIPRELGESRMELRVPINFFTI